MIKKYSIVNTQEHSYCQVFSTVYNNICATPCTAGSAGVFISALPQTCETLCDLMTATTLLVIESFQLHHDLMGPPSHMWFIID
jgi:hypothetical protein